MLHQLCSSRFPSAEHFDIHISNFTSGAAATLIRRHHRSSCSLSKRIKTSFLCSQNYPSDCTQATTADFLPLQAPPTPAGARPEPCRSPAGARPEPGGSPAGALSEPGRSPLAEQMLPPVWLLVSWPQLSSSQGEGNRSQFLPLRARSQPRPKLAGMPQVELQQ